jgi:hypothetical protein
MSKPDPRTIRRMLKEVEAVTKSRFHEDPDPVAGPIEMFRMPAGKKGGEPFAALSVNEKIQVLSDYTDWHSYEERGISSQQMDQVFRNVIDGKPREQWLEGTGLHVAEAARQDQRPAGEKFAEASKRLPAVPGKEKPKP